jgi:hypothetical protein
VAAALAALQEPPGWDRLGTEKIVCGADGQPLAGECAQLADAAGATICVRGQICRKRVLANNLLFFSMREASSATSWVASGVRLQVTAKPPDGGDLGAPGLPPDQQAAARRFSKLGDFVEVCGTAHVGEHGRELVATAFEVVERWAHAYPNAGFTPDIEPPSSIVQTPAAAPDAAAPLCKFWLSNGSCGRVGCRFAHGDSMQAGGRSREELRGEWQAERRAKKQATRQEARLAGDDVHGDRQAKSQRARLVAAWLVEQFGAARLAAGEGVLDVAGGRGELAFELAGRHGVRCTLVDPRRPGKLTKTQRKSIAAAEGERVGTEDGQVGGGSGLPPRPPRRIRAAFTVGGLALVSAAAPIKLDVQTTAIAHTSAQTKAAPSHGDALAAARRGWEEVEVESEAARVLAGCSLLVGLHPDQATEPLVRWATAHGKPWVVVPCCVFAAEAPGRWFAPGVGGAAAAEGVGGGGPATALADPTRKSVESYEDFILFLKQLPALVAAEVGVPAPAVHCGFLPFEGKNQVLWVAQP